MIRKCPGINANTYIIYVLADLCLLMKDCYLAIIFTQYECI